MNKLNVSIEKPVVVVVEGIDDRHLFDHLCDKWDMHDIQFISLNTEPGYDNVSAVVKLAGFDEKVRAFGITRDADDNFQSAKDSIENLLRRLSLNIKTDFFIFPDNTNTGMLETLLMQASSTDTNRSDCISAFIRCLESKTIVIPNNRKDKAKIYAYLSAFYEPGKRIGEAAHAGYWDDNSLIFNQVKRFFQNLIS